MPCGYLHAQQRRKMNRARSQGEQQPAERQCRVCERLLPIGVFIRDYTRVDGLSTRCSECQVIEGRARHAKRRVRFGGQPPGAPPPDVRICTQCKQIKIFFEFKVDNTTTASGRSAHCRKCDAMQSRCLRVRVRANSAS